MVAQGYIRDLSLCTACGGACKDADEAGGKVKPALKTIYTAVMLAFCASCKNKGGSTVRGR
jgi:hypothetical protein